MRCLILYLLMIVSFGVQAGSDDANRIETRYGTVDTVEHQLDTVDIRFRGKVVRSVEALAASLYRVTPNSQREFIIVDALIPGMYCHHFFVLVELYADGNADVSDQFGECQELEGTKFRGAAPLILLSDPYVPGSSRPRGKTKFEWRHGSIVQVSGDVPANSPSECAVINEATKVASSSIDPGHETYKVSGKGRLQFSSAPALGCE